MSKMPWFRAYTEMVDDEKLRLLAFEDRWHFVAILCLKGAGVLDASDPLMMRKVAVKMGLDVRSLEEVARRLSEVGLIDQSTLEPVKWESRQMRSDGDSTAAERKRRQRQRQKADAQNNGKERVGVTVTDTSRVTVTNVTRTDTEEDTEEDIEIEKAVCIEGGVGETCAPAANEIASPAAPAKPATRTRRVDPTGTRLPADWRLPQAWGKWALAERPDLTADDVRAQAACFADYWHSTAGAKGRKADWEATWRNWIRRCDGPSVVPRRAIAAPNAETAYQRSMRLRVAEIDPSLARAAPGDAADFFRTTKPMGAVVEVEATPVGRIAQ